MKSFVYRQFCTRLGTKVRRGLTLTLLVTMLSLFAATRPASANVTSLVLGSRSCGAITAYVRYDAYSEGNPPFYAVFSADLNGNGVYGEAGEPIQYVLVGPGGTAGFVRGTLTFPAVPEGSTIAVTAYEIDSDGTLVSAQLPAVSYTCSHRPATNLYPPNTGLTIPGVGISVKVTATSLLVYSKPYGTDTDVITGLSQGAILNVLGRNQRGDWLEVQLSGQTGWVMWVTKSILFGPYRQLPVVG